MSAIKNKQYNRKGNEDVIMGDDEDAFGENEEREAVSGDADEETEHDEGESGDADGGNYAHDDESSIRKKLIELYENVGSPAGYAGLERLRTEAQRAGLKVGKKELEAFLLAQPTYSKYRDQRRRFPRNPVMSFGYLYLVDADTHALPKFGRFVYFIVVVDILSQRVFAKAATNKKASTFAALFEDFVKSVGRAPQFLRTDRGTEYLGEFEAMLKRIGTGHIFAKGRLKASYAELYGKLLKRKFERHKERTGDKNWPRLLQSFCRGLNNRYLKSIGTTPSSVNYSNQSDVFHRVYKDVLGRENHSFHLQPGDAVRIALKKDSALTKGFTQNYSDEIFYVGRRTPRFPAPIYHLEDESGRELDRGYYYEELAKVLPEIGERMDVPGYNADLSSITGSQPVRATKAVRSPEGLEAGDDQRSLDPTTIERSETGR